MNKTEKSRWFGHPWLSILLAVSWLLLQHTLAPFHLISAVLIGLAVPRLLHGFLPISEPMRWLPAVRLLGVVLWDIVVSNITVARLVLGPISRLQPAWITVPLALSHPTAISLLASIITTTPGTVSCTIDEKSCSILVHALNCTDPAQMVADIQTRYERPLLAIFECPLQNTGKTYNTKQTAKKGEGP
ncbi:Na+/H+ antiporter subunit E [Polaromonas sp. CG_9.11]|uniref:Na+/H+ antiporter subunit E n=1 Tax=Polaromonas sp. CG_9.11 TaxID=2787730 RepID=UPI0018C939A4|nr:Na+/H+ antiporter subunit E [Polaromonas sp. CG_9.11]MBG6076534.1 multicomponent K+:H+ antiporter subunit E [Polaromonas sp. CG_9.11]